MPADLRKSIGRLISSPRTEGGETKRIAWDSSEEMKRLMKDEGWVRLEVVEYGRTSQEGR